MIYVLRAPGNEVCSSSVTVQRNFFLNFFSDTPCDYPETSHNPRLIIFLQRIQKTFGLNALRVRDV